MNKQELLNLLEDWDLPVGIKLISIQSGPPHFPHGSQYISVEISENYPLNSKEVMDKLEKMGFRYVKVATRGD